MMNNRIAILPGSFDPITFGHIDIINRSIHLFDQLILAVGINSQKQYLFPLETRIKWLHELFADEPKIKVESYENLTINFCKSKNASYIVRGLRNTTDFEFEKTISALNQSLDHSVETIFLMTSPDVSFIQSVIVREMLKHKGKIDHLVPACVIKDALQ